MSSIYNRPGPLMAGFDYQELHTADAVLDWILQPDEFTAIDLEFAEAGSLDDIVIHHADGRVLCRQVKFCATEPDSTKPLDWNMLLNPHEEGSTPWLVGWAASLERLSATTPNVAGQLITNRPASKELRQALRGPILRWQNINDPVLEQRIAAGLGGEERATKFLDRFAFMTDHFDEERLSEIVADKFARAGGAASQVEAFRRWIHRCVKHRDPGAARSGRRIDLAAAQEAAGIMPRSRFLEEAVAPLIRPVGTDSPSVDGAPAVSWRDYVIGRRVERDLHEHLRAPTPHPRWIAVTGHSGVGKSTLLKRLYGADGIDLQLLVPGTHLVSRDLATDGPTDADADGDSHLRGNIRYLRRSHLDRLPKSGRCVVAIDTLDAVINNVADAEPLAEFINTCLAHPGVLLVTTCRPAEFEEFCKNRLWTADATFRRLPVGDFDAVELDQAIDRYVQAFAKHLGDAQRKEAKERLRQSSLNRRNIHRILSHPLTLRLVFETFPDGNVPRSLRVIELFEAFWRHKVRAGTFHLPSPALREGILRYIAARMLRDRETRQSERTLRSAMAKHVADAALDKGIHALRSEEILRPIRLDELPIPGADGWFGSGAVRDSLEFFHDSFFEFVAAKVILAAGDQAVAALMRHVDAHTDLGMMAVLRQVALLDADRRASIITDLLACGRDLTAEVAIETYIQITGPAAAAAPRSDRRCSSPG